MDDALKQLFESSILGEDTKKTIKEAWDKQVKDLRTQAVTTVREEMSKRYTEDRNSLVEAMDKFMNDNIKQVLEDVNRERRGLSKARVKLNQYKEKITEMSAKKLNEHVKKISEFVGSHLKQEVSEFKQDRKRMVESVNILKKKLAEDVNTCKVDQDNGLKLLETFVAKHLVKEISEFQEDKNLLNEERGRFIVESKKQLAEAKKAFVSRASKVVEKMVETTLTSEMTQLKEDLAESRKNNFGKRIFEAFAKDFMVSHMSEGSTVRKYHDRAKELEKCVSEMKDKVLSKDSLLKETTQKLRRVKDQTAREIKISSLLQPLSESQKGMMRQLLRGVRSERLDEQYKFHLSAVLSSPKLSKKSSVISEGRKPSKSNVMTGFRKNRLSESIDDERREENLFNKEIGNLTRLAGV